MRSRWHCRRTWKRSCRARRAYLRALAAGEVPDEMRPPAERGSGAGTFGHACGLGDAGFAAWTCAAGFECVAVDDDRVGQCMPAAPRAGSACHPGPVSFASDRIKAPRDARVWSRQRVRGIGVGFPGGMCASACASLAPGEACGAIALLTPFNNCLARGTAFAECAQARAARRPGRVRRAHAVPPRRPVRPHPRRRQRLPAALLRPADARRRSPDVDPRERNSQIRGPVPSS